MNPFHYHHTIPFYVSYGVPIFPVNVHAPRPVQAVPVHYATGEHYPLFVSFLDDAFILNIPNTPSNRQPTQNHYIPAYTRPQDMYYDSLEEETFLMEADDSAPQLSVGSGLSQEDISKRLHVYTARGGDKVVKEVITCSICLCDFENSHKIGRLDCGHQFHAACIETWLLNKNTCPMCRSHALRV